MGSHGDAGGRADAAGAADEAAEGGGPAGAVPPGVPPPAPLPDEPAPDKLYAYGMLSLSAHAFTLLLRLWIDGWAVTKEFGTLLLMALPHAALVAAANRGSAFLRAAFWPIFVTATPVIGLMGVVEGVRGSAATTMLVSAVYGAVEMGDVGRPFVLMAGTLAAVAFAEYRRTAWGAAPGALGGSRPPNLPFPEGPPWPPTTDTPALFLSHVLALLLGFFMIAHALVRLFAAHRREFGRAETERQRAEAASAAKDLFVRSLSHEMRTPLNSIIGTSTHLMSTPLDEAQRELCATLLASSNMLLAVVDDVLDHARIDAGALKLELVPVDLRCVVREVAAMVRTRPGVKLGSWVAPGVPKRVLADPTRTRQVLLNFAGNAAKFASEGFVSISVEVTGEASPLPSVFGGEDEAWDVRYPHSPPGEGPFLVFRVSDSGIGIPAALFPALFRAPFSQAHPSHARTYGGTGLGLTISARLAELMGGWVACRSREGTGSEFAAGVPLVVCEEREEKRGRKRGRGGSEGARVLIAEDNETNMDILARHLVRLGYHRIQRATDGRQAVEAVEAADRAGEPFDVVLMDVSMPVLDGLSAARVVRSLPLRRPPRILACTANVLPEDVRACTEAGMDGFVAKPVRARALEREMEAAVGFGDYEEGD
ncbi:hypothetical protein DFJ74DRAFT_695798 [Hyaloraphidium curvatum]|nr:hypothetical protein DFJ74DRAFT_695798 [Hyaloraphidium curvatum]